MSRFYLRRHRHQRLLTFSMIRLKQKKAEEEKKAAEEKKSNLESSTAAVGAIASSSSILDHKSPLDEAAADKSTQGGGLKLLGIGGKGARTGIAGKSTGKKRTPGEIRIQKGELSYFTN